MNTRLKSAALLVVGAAASGACSAANHSHGFVSTLGTDTVAVESMTLEGTAFSGVLVERSPRLAVWTYSGSLHEDGTVAEFEVSVAAGPGEDARESHRMVFADGVVTVESTRGGDTSSRDVQVEGAFFPWKTTSFGLYQLATRAAARAETDSLPIAFLSERSRGPTPNSVTRHADAGMTIRYFGMPIRFNVDDEGNVTSASGEETTNRVEVIRDDGVDPLSVAADWEASGAASLGQLSPRDTTTATIGAATITVDYGRPSRRGREIFGGILAYDEVWRTGANLATHFTTSRDLTIEGTPVPAGSYTLWSIPQEGSLVLIVNQQTGQWGTSYDAAQDLVRLELERVELPEPVELFTIVVEQAGSGGVLALEWHDSRFEAEIRIR